MEVINIDKHVGCTRDRFIYDHKKFYGSSPIKGRICIRVKRDVKAGARGEGA
jgi:hypothetical protein